VELCRAIIEVIDRETQRRSDQFLTTLGQTADLDALYTRARNAGCRLTVIASHRIALPTADRRRAGPRGQCR